MTTTTLTRQECIDRLQWENGEKLSETIERVPGFKDWKSVVTVLGEPLDYTDDELRNLVQFSEEHTARYDSRWKVRRGMNLILVQKYKADRWHARRLSWTQGPMYWESWEKVVEVFNRPGR